MALPFAANVRQRPSHLWGMLVGITAVMLSTPGRTQAHDETLGLGSPFARHTEREKLPNVQTLRRSNFQLCEHPAHHYRLVCKHPGRSW